MDRKLQYEVSYRLDDIISDAFKELVSLDNDKADISRGKGKWTKKELLGHLIDSVANNHQRLVRIGHYDGGKMAFPDYAADAWVATNGYAAMDWETLVVLWHNYNKLLSHIIRNLSDAVLSREVLYDGKSDLYVTIGELVQHYCNHMEHHLKQIIS